MGNNIFSTTTKYLYTAGIAVFMQLKSIKIQNIRSYLNEKIDFSDGSVMLSGDIGSGKSTILLAAEFALFGIMKGDVSGESLLRNGKNEGSVELCLEINGKEVHINRTLKRSKSGVKQEAGYLIVDGVKKAATATELKALILEMLGYPKDLITKSKGLIYRYTVYTPQEEMKRILFEDQESRLNTLRKVFDVDKYKRIRENAKIYASELKGKVKEIEGSIEDLEDKKRNAEEMMKEVEIIESQIKEVTPMLEFAKEEAEKQRKAMRECEKDIEKLSMLRQELAGCEADLKNKLAQRQRNSLEIERISKQAGLLRSEVKGKPADDVSEQVIQKEIYAREFEEKKIEVSKKIAEIEARKKQSDEIKEKISRLDKCPLCLQNVSHEHKKKIDEKEDDNIAKLDNYLSAYSAQEKEADENIRKAREELAELRKMHASSEALKVKIANLKQAEADIQRLNAEQAGMKTSIGEINTKKIEVSEGIEKLKYAEEKYKAARGLVDNAEKKFMEIKLMQNTLETKKREKASFVENIKLEIARKEEAKSKLRGMRDLQQWLDSNFVNLMALMEKQVMAKVYHSFNELFQNWFNMLMEDETIAARLDDSFTPVIQQNGFETNMAYLSGGEKTSCALAYRLALNKVINDLITTIQTKDLIILDEPTDGFSTEQLDRVREVVEQLNMKQVIIVSHEQKVEGFVDNVIRIQKNEHVSSVA